MPHRILHQEVLDYADSEQGLAIVRTASVSATFWQFVVKKKNTRPLAIDNIWHQEAAIWRFAMTRHASCSVGGAIQEIKVVKLLRRKTPQKENAKSSGASCTEHPA
jgi:hypothetical protein